MTDQTLTRFDFESCVESTNGEDPNIRPYDARHYLLAHDASQRAKINRLEGALAVQVARANNAELALARISGEVTRLKDQLRDADADHDAMVRYFREQLSETS